MRRSNALLRQFRESRFNGFATLFVGGFGNHTAYGRLRRFPQNARGFAIFVAVDVPALRIAAGQCDASQLQGSSVGHGNVTVDPLQKYRMSRRRLRPDPSAWAWP